MEKLLGTGCPRPGCAGRIEGVEGFKNSVAIREGIFGKGGGRAKEKTDHVLIKKVKDKKKDKDTVRNSQRSSQ